MDTTAAIFSALFAGFSALFAFLAVRKANKANELAEHANMIAIESNRVSVSANDLSISANSTADGALRTAMGEIEISIHSIISHARADFRMYILKFAESTLPGAEMSDILHEAYIKILAECAEGLLNAYEEACAKYNDGKVDKDRFRKLYKNELLNLGQNKFLSEKLNDKTYSYQAIKAATDDMNKHN